MIRAQRGIVLLFGIAMLVLVFSQPVAVAVSVGETGKPDYSNYKQIPGVTQKEIDAVERIKALRGHLEFGAGVSLNAFPAADGQLGGFFPLLVKRLEEIFGIPFTIAVYDRDTLGTRMADRQTDFTCAPVSGKGDGRTLSVETGVREPVFMYKKRLRNSYAIWKGRNGPVPVGFLEGSPLAGAITLPTADFVPVLVANYNEAVAALESGTIVAFFDYKSAVVEFNKHPGLSSREFLPRHLSPVAISTANPDFAAIIAVLEKYLVAGGQQELLALYKQGEADYGRSKLFATLSEEERAYIEAHKATPVPFAASKDNYPICFYDETKQRYQGISIEVLKEISELTGLAFAPSNKLGEIWPNLLEDLDHGRTALVTELIYTDERGKKYLWPATAYTSDSYALISRVEQEDISLEQISDYRIGVISGTGYMDDFIKWFPDHDKQVEFSTYAEAFDALGNRDVDFVMGTKNLLLNISNYLEKTGFRANTIFDYEYDSAYGFHPSQRVLRDIFSKAQELIDMNAIAHRWTLRVYDYQGKLEREEARNNSRIMLLVVVLLIITVSLVIALSIKRKQMAESLNRTLEETVRQRTAELEKQTDSALEASKAKNDFLARMSHEIRTPLNAIIGLSHVAKHASEPGSKAYNATSGAMTAATHLLGILNDVLDMTKLEAGKLVLTVESFPFKEAMDEVVSIIAERCSGKKLTFEHNVDTLIPITVEGDKLRMKQVLINLLGNAAKFTLPGGSVRFQVDCAPPSEKGIVRTTFTVSDSGIGISDDQLERIYLAFEQANASIATNFGGVGLGLSISQKLVSMMGGVISVQSQVNVGSTFVFALDLPLVEAVLEDGNRDVDAVDLTGKRILYAEDVEINRVILEEYLAETNVQIDEAEDGQIACTMFEQAPSGYYDLILMDIQMPNMDGCEAARKIRAFDRPDARSVPIVAVTANAYQEDISRAIMAGMNRHLPKPVDFGQLMTMLREMFPSAE